jgi:hypothetical protein
VVHEVVHVDRLFAKSMRENVPDLLSVQVGDGPLEKSLRKTLPIARRRDGERTASLSSCRWWHKRS